MLEGIIKEDIVILVDFDGTITDLDTNDALGEKYATEEIMKILENEEGLNSKEFFIEFWNEIKISEEEYLEFILNEIKLTKGFYSFYKKAKELNIPLVVLSAGFENGIKPFLNKNGIKDIEVYANKLNFDENNITVDFYHSINDCCEKGYCGNCKVLHYERYKHDGHKVIFIGDGASDRAVANISDIVFAKDRLLKYCEAENIEYIPWTDFDDISRLLWK